MRNPGFFCVLVIILIIMSGLFLFPAAFDKAIACGGGGGGGGGGDATGDESGWVSIPASEAFHPTPPTVEELAEKFGPVWAAHNIINPKTGMTKYEEAAVNQRALEYQAEQAYRGQLNSETAYSGAKATGTGATVAAGIVATVASGGAAAVPVTMIGIGGDALAAGAGATAEAMVNENKSLSSALKSAVGPAIAKGAVSGVLSKINTGSNVVNGVVSTVGALSYDEAVSGAPNTATKPAFDPPPSGPTSPSAIVPSSGTSPHAM